MKICISIDEFYPFFSFWEGEKGHDIHPAQLQWLKEVTEDFYSAQQYLETLYREDVKTNG